MIYWLKELIKISAINILIYVSISVFFSALSATKAALKKKIRLIKLCLSFHCHHLNENSVVKSASKGHRPKEHSGKRLWQRRCQDSISNEKK